MQFARLSLPPAVANGRIYLRDRDTLYCPAAPPPRPLRPGPRCRCAAAADSHCRTRALPGLRLAAVVSGRYSDFMKRFAWLTDIHLNFTMTHSAS
jgi:hypothetical protein